jgi:hypothetical protein
MTPPTFTEPCDFTINWQWFDGYNFSNERKRSDTLQLIGGDVKFSGYSITLRPPSFHEERCNYPYIAMYVRGPSHWLLVRAVASDAFLALLRLINFEEDYFFIGIRDITTAPEKVTYG